MRVPQFRELKVANIKGADYNPPDRTEGASLRELADSMSRIGLIYPVLVDDKNVLIDGHRRTAAAKSLGWETIPALVAPSEQRDRIYAGVNATAKKMAGKHALGIWMKNKDAVSVGQSRVFDAMVASIGLSTVNRIVKEGLSARVWDTAKRIGRYCQIDDVKRITVWLLDHAVIGQVMKALE